MANRDFTRLLIEGTVNHTISQLRKSPRRSIRTLVDLGLSFSRGRFQTFFLELAQTMLADEHSAYYDLLERLTRQVDPETLKTFGINLGYEGLTRGAKTIRDIEAAGIYNIPWCLPIVCGRNGLDRLAVNNIVHQGTAQGIYIYALLADSPDLTDWRHLMDDFPKCAFILMTSGETILEQTPEPLRNCRNVFVMVGTGESGLEAAHQMAGAGLFYGIFHRYHDDSCLSPEALDGYLKYDPVVVLLLSDSTEMFPLAERMYPRVKELRLAQQYPYFLVEGLSDGLYIDHVISGDACSLLIRGDGSTLGIDLSGARAAGNILDVPLTQILRQAAPKRPGVPADDPQEVDICHLPI